MKTKIDSATIELDAYLEEFEEKIEETTEKLAKNISSQCELNSEESNDALSDSKFQDKAAKDQLMVNKNGVPSILRCFQCCEEIPLTTEFLDSITNGLYSQEKQRKFSYKPKIKMPNF